ncbi:molybdate ABC transporter ATP-binding protein ModF [Lonepinella sp. BR2474]|uniref:molybdate ABC transporter ATP-binding protein ModF n=1 Tax=Lonepinella sp. BR2474 TaxID=3434548 RepID=UPI003F6E357F
MKQVKIIQAEFLLQQKNRLKIPHFQIRQGDFWVVVGSNGSGKTAFSLAIEGKIPVYSGEYENSFQHIQQFSFEKQQKILEQTFRERNNDSISPDDFGKTARETILNGTKNEALCQQYAELLGITSLLDRPFMHLSTGESRKILLAQTLVQQPDLLILDEPFEGLDQKSVQDWQHLLERLAQQTSLLLIVNRFNDIPTAAKQIALLDHCEVILQGERAEIEQQSIFQQLQYAENVMDVPLPECTEPMQKLDPNTPHFELEKVTIQYADKVILDQLTWRVLPQQHWWIKGPNGAGKSTLLSILTGDHPQAYSNIVRLFGRQRGSGETIWEIKSKMGYISSQLHMDYRVNCSVLDVIISGFFDSIGVYQRVPDALRVKAMQWLERINLALLAKKPFRSLSWGQQRLLLITRAMVKYPPVLILDEPLQGLDGLNRRLVKSFIDQLVKHSGTQLLFVSHQDQDAPQCITHIFEFVPKENGYQYVQTAV